MTYNIPPTEYNFECVLPPNDEYAEWHDMPEYQIAKARCQSLVHAGRDKAHHHHVVEVIDNDKDINAYSIELSGEASITWDLQQNGNVPILRYLTLHLKSLDKFVSFSITVLDESLKTRIFKISNHRSHCVISTAQVDGEEVSICELPMEIGHSWQMCCLDLVNLCEKAFGTTKPNTLSITVNGNCRVSKVFFHKERYADAEMPAHLRCVS
ncbi:hypothetical protein TrVE_jg13459 [Triparma verrucosa]|uniref:CFA20 domain-containing protein n=1 Tax=Triparma verrucosa TaxID=1606542 RepID=A0A9W7FCW5_9STRA|nr:hypothetical protein TrVE_jg13459 [Triparma verrucosa]